MTMKAMKRMLCVDNILSKKLPSIALSNIELKIEIHQYEKNNHDYQDITATFI